MKESEMTATFTYRAPRLRTDLLTLLAEFGPAARLFAGGTDLIPDIRNGVRTPALVINLKNVAGYSDISWSADDGLLIGPAVTINDVLFDPKVAMAFPLLTACARDLASHQIRNRATVVGNIANASPCADMAPALLCLGASAVIASLAGSRTVPFTEFFTGVKRTVIQPGEVLERIIVPPASAGARGTYHKLKRIKGHDLGIVGVAASNNDGALRLGISSCAPTPLLVDGLSVTDPVDDVVAAARHVISPISDVRCSREYREHMVEVYVRRTLREVA
jgi:CO/xanthine dehydrogenase FAD-binding subunit